MRAVMLSGGGIDSTTLLVYLKTKVLFDQSDRLHVLHVNYGQKAWNGEKQSVDYFSQKYNVPVKRLFVELSPVAHASILRGTSKGMDKQANKLEGRNCVLVALAGTYASTIGASTIYLGCHDYPANSPAPFLDETEHAINTMQKVLTECYAKPLGLPGGILLRAPFIRQTKLDVMGMAMAADPEIMTHSFTCYESGRRHWWGGDIQECGECVHCRTKASLLAELARQEQQRMVASAKDIAAV